MRLPALLLLLLLATTTVAQTGLGALVGYSRNDHWFRSNVGLGACAEHAFRHDRWSLRAALFAHVPMHGRHEGVFNGDPQPVSFASGADSYTYDRYWSAALDLEPLFRISSSGASGLHLHGLAGFGYRYEQYDFETRTSDPTTGAPIERSGRVLRDRWAHRAGLELRYGLRPSEVFLGLLCDPFTYVIGSRPGNALAWFQEYGLRFGFIHTIHHNKSDHVPPH